MEKFAKGQRELDEAMESGFKAAGVVLLILLIIFLIKLYIQYF